MKVNMRFTQTEVRALNGESDREPKFFICKEMQVGWMNAIKQTCHGFEKANLIERVKCMKV